MASLTLTERIQERIDVYCREHIVVSGGVISPRVANGGRYFYGGADTLLNSQHQPLLLNRNTPFEIGSLSKTFASAVFYQLRGGFEGVLGDFIDGLPDAVADIAIHDLVTYAPGLPQDNAGAYWTHAQVTNLQTLLNFINSPQFPEVEGVGTCYAYSNFGWLLVGLAAIGIENPEVNYGRNYNAALAHLFSSLGLQMQATRRYSTEVVPQLPVGYFQAVNPGESPRMFPLGANYKPAPSLMCGAGTLVSTAHDMMLWLSYNMGRLTGPTEALIEQQTVLEPLPQCGNPGLDGPPVSAGWFQPTQKLDSAGTKFLAKDGGVDGFTSWMGFKGWVDTGAPSPMGVFVMTNSHHATTLGEDLLSLVFEAGD